MSNMRIPLFPLQKKSHFVIFCVLTAIILVFSCLVAVGTGAADVSLEEVWKVIVNNLFGSEVFEKNWENSTDSIIWTIRTPRVLTAFVVGAGLTLCGILMQVLTKNPLADPYVLGISQGASAGAVAAIVYGFLSFLGGYGTMAGAFLGALISIALSLRIATIRNKVTATQLVLAGIAVSALFGALTNLMIYHTAVGSDKVKTATYWMMGSLSGASWERLLYAAIAFFVCFALILLLSKKLDVLMLGDERVTYASVQILVDLVVGVDTGRLKIVIIVVATLLTGIIVSISGTIGFVGLTIPHITRSIVGTKHMRLVPASMLVGGTFLVIADILSRVLVAPEELPIGVVSAFFGAPFFLYLIRRSNAKLGR